MSRRKSSDISRAELIGMIGVLRGALQDYCNIDNNQEILDKTAFDVDMENDGRPIDPIHKEEQKIIPSPHDGLDSGIRGIACIKCGQMLKCINCTRITIMERRKK